MNRRFDRDNFGMMRPGFGYRFGFPLLGLLARLLFWGLIIAGLYWLITRSGWRLTRVAPVSTAASTTPTVDKTPPPAEENRPSDTP